MGEVFAAFGINWKLLLAQSFNFGLLLLALWYFLYRPVIAILEKRRKTIEKGVSDAEKAKKRLTEIDGEREDILAKATNDGNKIVGDAKERAEEKKAEILTEADKRAESLLTDAQARAREAKERALRESKEEIAKTAILAAEKIMRK